MPQNKTRKSREKEKSDSTALAIRPSNSALASNFFDEFMRPFEEFTQPFFPSVMRSFWQDLDNRQPRLDIQDRGDHFTLTAELPGFTKDDVEVQINSNSLELKAEKRSENKSNDANGTHEQKSYSYFHRYLTLPEQVVADEADGTMKNGILELKLPKKEPKARDEPRRVDLK